MIINDLIKAVLAHRRCDGSFQWGLFEETQRAESLLQTLESLWRGRLGVRENDAAILSSPPEILSVIGRFGDNMTRRAYTICLRCINEGKIGGRVALYCISEMQGSLLQYISRAETTSKLAVHETIEFVKSIAMLSIEPLFSSELDTQSNSSMQLPSLELLPSAINVLIAFDRRFSAYKGCHAHILDLLLSSDPPWQRSSFALVANLIADLSPFLISVQWHSLKMRFLTAVQYLASDDYAAVITICLKLYEKTGDKSWAHILRVIYMHIPQESIQTTEALLEQMFGQSEYGRTKFIDLTEDVAINWMRAGANAKAGIHTVELPLASPILAKKEVH